MIFSWHRSAWAEYVQWQASDPKMVAKINEVLEDVRRSPFTGLGKPEPLKEDWAGWWSRRLTDEHRLVYRVRGKGADQLIEIAKCRSHY